MPKQPRIALIHATPIAIGPIQAAFAASWPEAERVNLLEDSLSVDRSKSAQLTPEMNKRIKDLAGYAERIGSDAVLFTCSAFGRAIEAAADGATVPVLKPNEAMFEAALKRGSRVAMIYTFEPSREGMEAEFHEEADKVNPSATIASFLAPGAIDAIKGGDVATHNRLVAEQAAAIKGYDAIVLAHFSTSQAAAAARAATDIPVLTSPDAAVAKVRALLEARGF